MNFNGSSGKSANLHFDGMKICNAKELCREKWLMVSKMA